MCIYISSFFFLALFFFLSICIKKNEKKVIFNTNFFFLYRKKMSIQYFFFICVTCSSKTKLFNILLVIMDSKLKEEKREFLTSRHLVFARLEVPDEAQKNSVKKCNHLSPHAIFWFCLKMHFNLEANLLCLIADSKPFSTLKK